MTNPNLPPAEDELTKTQPLNLRELHALLADDETLSRQSFENSVVRHINQAYGRAVHDRVPIRVEPAPNPKGPNNEHISALAAARQRVGHLTGSLALKHSTEIE